MINVEEGNSISNTYNLLLRTAIIVQKYSDSTLYKKAGLSTVKYIVLEILASSDNPVTPSEISRLIVRERHDVTTLIDRMKRDGLVEVEPSATDRRSVHIILTALGQEKLEKAKPVVEDIMGQVMKKVGETANKSLSRLLTTLNQNALDGIKEITGKTWR